MIEKDIIFKGFNKTGGVLKTSELNVLGLSSRQIKKLLENGTIVNKKYSLMSSLLDVDFFTILL